MNLTEQQIKQIVMRKGLKIGCHVVLKYPKRYRGVIEINFIEAKVIALYPFTFLVEIKCKKNDYKRKESFQYKQILLEEVNIL